MRILFNVKTVCEKLRIEREMLKRNRSLTLNVHTANTISFDIVYPMTHQIKLLTGITCGSFFICISFKYTHIFGNQMKNGH